MPYSGAAGAAAAPATTGADRHSDEWGSRRFGSGHAAQSSSSSFASAPLIGPSSGDRGGPNGSGRNGGSGGNSPQALADGNNDTGAGGPSRADGQADDGFNSNLSGASNVMVTVRVRPVLQTDQAKMSIVNVLDKKVSCGGSW